MAVLDTGKIQEGLSILTKTVNETTKSYREQLQELKGYQVEEDRWYKTNKKSRDEKQRVAKKVIDQELEKSKALSQIRSAIEDASLSYKSNGQITEKNIESIEEQIKTAKELGIELGDVTGILKDAKNGDLKGFAELLPDLDEATNKHIKTQAKITESAIKVAERSNVLGRKFDQLVTSTKHVIKQFFSVGTATSLLTTGFARAFSEVQKAAAHQIDTYGFLSQTMTTFSLGLSSVDAQDLIINNKQLVNSMGGVKSTFEVLGRHKDEMFKYTQNMKDASDMTLSIASNLQSAGVRLDNLSINGLDDSLKSLTKEFAKGAVLTGKSTLETAKLMKQTLEDADMQKQLRKMSEQQRKEYVKNLQAFKNHTHQLGMSSEQTEKFINTVNKLKGADPMERLKMAAKVQMAAGSLGIEGGDRAAAILRKGKAASPEETEFLRQFSDKMGRSFDQLAGGDIGQQLYGSALQKQLGGFNEIIEQSNSTLLQSKSLTDEQVDAEMNRAKTLRESSNILKEVNTLYEQMKPYLEAPSTSIILGAISAIGSLGSAIVGVVASLWGASKIIGIISGGFGLVAGGFNFLKGGFSTLADFVVASAKKLKDGAVRVGTAIAENATALRNGATRIGEGIAENATKLKGGIKTVATTLSENAGGMLKTGLKIAKFGGALSLAAYGSQQFYQAVTEGESDVSKMVSKTFPDFYIGLGDLLGDMVGGAKAFGSDVAEWGASVVDGAVGIIDDLGSFGSDLGLTISDIADDIGEGFDKFVDNPLGFMADLGRDFTDGIMGIVTGVQNKAMNILGMDKAIEVKGEAAEGFRKLFNKQADKSDFQYKTDFGEMNNLKEEIEIMNQRAKDAYDLQQEELKEAKGFFGSQTDIQQAKDAENKAKDLEHQSKILTMMLEALLDGNAETHELKAIQDEKRRYAELNPGRVISY